MKTRFFPVRSWYAGKTPIGAKLLATVEAADPDPQLLYDCQTVAKGPYAEVFKRLYHRMDLLKRHPLEFRSWTQQDGMETFFETLLDFTAADLRHRIQILQRLGDFTFRKSDGPREKKAKIEAIFAQPQDDEDFNALRCRQAAQLTAIWSPTPNSLLDDLANHPAQIGRQLADRLNLAHNYPLKLIGHSFTEVPSSLLQPLVEFKTIAYERHAEIHLITPVLPVLEKWDQDAMAADRCAQLTLLDALLLHELMEVMLNETEPELESLEAHIVASTFERYLKGQILQVAVEDFFLDWPPLSNVEVEERRQRELSQQLEQINCFLEKEEIPKEEEEDLEGLPLDPVIPKLKRKRKTGG